MFSARYRSSSAVSLGKLALGFQQVAHRSTKAAVDAGTTVVASKRNISQSPLKMQFLVTLIRNTWVPDAFAQLKFTPKLRAPDVAKVLRRATAVAKIFHEAVPEELWIKEVVIRKGSSMKRMRIMGKGRTGFGYKRKANLVIKVEKIDFEQRIKQAVTFSQRKKWMERQKFVQEVRMKREGASSSKIQPPASYFFM